MNDVTINPIKTVVMNDVIIKPMKTGGSYKYQGHDENISYVGLINKDS